VRQRIAVDLFNIVDERPLKAASTCEASIRNCFKGRPHKIRERIPIFSEYINLFGGKMKKFLSLLLVAAMLLGVTAAVSAQDKTYLERAYEGEFKGKTVIFDGPFIDNDQVLFEESIKDFEEKTGIDIQYIGNKDFESTIQMRAEGGNAPDIADVPQPGLMANLAAGGYLVDVRDSISEDC
jgi:maltose-binding protein MalE